MNATTEIQVLQPENAVPPIASAPESAAGSMLNFIASAVTDPNVDVAKLEALLRMQREVLADDAKSQFNRSLAALAGEMPQVEKRGTVSLRDKDGKDKGHYKFARWEDIDHVLRPLMLKHGFTLSFTTAPRAAEGGGAIVKGELLHAGGHTRSSEISLSLDSGPGRNNLQALGSTISYGKRLVAEMLLNIVRKGVDDDGQASGELCIDADCVRTIKRLLDETKGNSASFLDFFGAERIEMLRQKDYPKAVNALMARLAKKVKPEPGAAP